jgi:hypothetical protein
MGVLEIETRAEKTTTIERFALTFWVLVVIMCLLKDGEKGFNRKRVCG